MTTKSDSNFTGPRLRVAREKKGLSEVDLSSLCHEKGLFISSREITEIEDQRRVVNDFELITLAKALEVSGTDLLFGEGPLPWEKP
ncbi:MAG: helix-turn-helix domain-containing protein [Verrucomicrobiales bacterium]